MKSIFSKKMNATRIFGLALLATVFINHDATFAGGRFTRANSPYIINGDLRVSAGDSLIIEPGVELRFSASSSFIVEGLLIAQGTEQDSIFFTVNSVSPTSGSWNGVFLYNSSARPLRRVVVSFAATGITCDGGAPIIEHSDFRRNVNGIDFLNGTTAQIRYSLFLQNENAAIRCIGASPKIELNAITQNALTGFESAIVCNGASPRIQRNIILGNGHSGIDCVNGSSAEIYQNTLANNEFGVTISDSDPKIYNNIITGSSFGISGESAQPEIFYNNVFGNSDGNFLDCPAGVGELSAVNFNGHASDAFGNISFHPLYVNPAENDYRIGQGSSCIDAGSPDNPAGGEFVGARPDLGFLEFDGAISDVSRGESTAPEEHALQQNYPNPFNPETTIDYSIGGTTGQSVRLTIYNSLGQLVRQLIDTSQAPGQYQVHWNGKDEFGRQAGSGVFFSRLQVNKELHIRKMLLTH